MTQAVWGFALGVILTPAVIQLMKKPALRLGFDGKPDSRAAKELS